MASFSKYLIIYTFYYKILKKSSIKGQAITYNNNGKIIQMGEFMEEGYKKEKKIREKSEEETQLELIKSIIDAKRQLNLANKNFEYADGELIDYYAYQIKATRSKLDYLVKKAKSKKMEIDMISELKMRLEQNEAI